ncbi:MAG: efflux RND transporter permease subunit [Luteitalea sp.]
MARFFIDRPIFAWVIAIVIMLAGALALIALPVAQYPAIAPPAITINATYPGASARTLEDTVTQVIEQRMKGLDHLQYVGATSDSTGTVTMTLTFEPGSNADIAQVQVQNKLQLALPLLPQEVQRQGVQVSKARSNILLVLGFVSSDGSMTATDIADYTAANIQDPISRVPGVGNVLRFGSQYAMRIWLDPHKLQNYAMTPADVRAAILAQNAQVSAGQLGAAPAVDGQQLNATITAQSRLQRPEQFEAIVLRTDVAGAVVRLRDVARVELGSENYDVFARYNGKPAAGMAVQLATGANALDTADAVRARVDELSQYFPPGMEAVVAFDTTPFVRISIEEVIKTLVEAVVLVFVVMYLFLQNFRATLIPTIAVPVVLLGTFGVLAAFGFSINTLTMFGMVLAIGLLVDDAIVVVENVERVMQEEGLPPLEATRKSMDQITGALIGIALVLSAVFVPMSFFGGSTGVIYRQFSITIVSSMVLSVIVALVLTPALCATLLKPVAQGHGLSQRGFFGWFNRSFDRGSGFYQSLIGRMVARTLPSLAVYAVLLGVLGVLFLRLPTAFLPEEDQGVLFSQVQLPAGGTQQATLAVLEKLEKHYLETEKDAVQSLFAVAGFSFGGRGQNMGLTFVRLKPWDERKGASLRAQAVVGRAMVAFSQIREAMVFAFAPPAVSELGNATGFDLQLQDRGGLGHEGLMAARNQLLGLAARHPALVGVRPNGLEDTPEYRLHVDTERAGALGVSVADINDMLSSAWGSAYVNDFIDRGRVKRVFMQADAPYRMQPEHLDAWYARNRTGEMVPFSSFATSEWTFGSPRLERYNDRSSVQVLGAPAPGRSSGEAMDVIEELATQLPAGIGYEWTGLSYQERLSGSQAPALYATSLLVVFLCLAALYESWSVPLSVMLVVPLGVLGAVLAATLRGLSNDVYFQVGLLTTIGLAAKNAILIVEFAKDLQERGQGLVEATLAASRQRLRPILMTSLAFGFGVLPLAVSTGAGSGSQNAIGIGVLGGVAAATMLGVLLIPVFFVVVRRVFARRTTAATDVATAGADVAATPPLSDDLSLQKGH